MKVRITKADGDLYDGEAKLLQLPGVDGLFEMLDNHAPIISALASGSIRLVDTLNETHQFTIRGGVVKGRNNDVLLLVQ